MTGNLFISMDFGLNTPEQPGTDDGTQRPWTSDKPIWYSNNSIRLDPGVDIATVDQPTHIKVRVSNKGAQVMKSVMVEAWFFIPGIGDMKPPGAFHTFVSGLADVPAGGSTVFTCDTDPVWVPSDTDLAKTNGGHACIIANCFQSDEFVADPEGRPVDINQPVASNGDQHQGQRNIQIIKVQKAVASAPQRVTYTTYPPTSSSHHEYLVSATHVNPGIERFDPTTESVLVSQEGVEAFETGVNGGSGLNLITSGGPVEIRPATDPPTFELRTEGMPRELGTRFRFEEDRADQIDSEVIVQLPPDAEVGSLHSFDLGMWADNGELVGSGMHVLVLVTE
ncbi:hypothetical protein PUR57_25110 [Streptomyces sp. JV176]|uniref:hypothetical protein n=1 Tax=Streptomyces sp. JV176 TaxID=858630 RepID=UPI002E76D6C5|nr:hypothetical protein [Streptomyces sp. JV176]MEE1801928.1 hypothetical protein [Streptomyces sp. JV176]